MKRFVLLFILIFILCGCGKNEEPSVVSCKYSQSDSSVSVAVEMRFERDLEKKLITNGSLIMTYDFESVEVDKENNTSAFIASMFEGACDNLDSTYKDCSLNINDNSVDVIMDFDLDVLEKSSGGRFKKSMTVNQVKSFILSDNKINGLVCTTE